MTAALTTPRPVLYLVPGTGRRARPPVPVPPPVVGGSLGPRAAEVTARVLGTVFAPVAAGLAQSLAARSPLLARRGRPEVWAAAIAYLLADQARLFDYDHRITRTSLARELGATLPTLRRRAADIRSALHPLELDLPDPVVD